MFPLESEPSLTGEKHFSLNVPDLPDKRAAETLPCSAHLLMDSEKRDRPALARRPPLMTLLDVLSAGS